MNYFIHSVIVLSVTQAVFGNGSDVAITQPMESCPNLRSCFTLASCLQNTSVCLVDNSVVIFSPGNHFTDDQPGFFLIRKRRNLTLKVEHSISGQKTAFANIHCSNGIGFAFFQMYNFTIIGLRFHDCGAPIPDPLYAEARSRQSKTYYYFFEGTKTALFMVNIYNLVIDTLHVNNSDGYGLFIINALGNSSISNSKFSYNNHRVLHYHQYNPGYCDAGHIPNVTKCTGGNLVVLLQDEPYCHNQLPEYVLQITNSTFSYGVNLDYHIQDPPANYVYNAGGLSIFSGQVTYSLHVHVSNIVANNNIGHNGANAVVYIHDLKGVDVNVTIECSQFINGNADLEFSSNVAYAGGIYMYYGECVCSHYKTCNTQMRYQIDSRAFVLASSTFINNHGFRGAAINLVSVVHDQDLNSQVEIANFHVFGCTIINNKGYVGIIQVTESRTSTDSAYQMRFILSNTVISNNLLMEVVHTSLLKLLPERSYTYPLWAYLNRPVISLTTPSLITHSSVSISRELYLIFMMTAS